MAANPTAGGTATDLTNAAPYTSGTVVNIQAVANAGYQFVEWTAPAGTFANETAATTTFTMPAQDVTVTANFMGLLDHFKGYNVTLADSIGAFVYLEDQFGVFNATVTYPWLFCNPAAKRHNGVPPPILNPDHHLTAYQLFEVNSTAQWFVKVDNQFGSPNLTVFGPVMLAVPTQKVAPGDHDPPVGLDHFLLYTIISVSPEPPVGMTFNLTDQFGDEEVELWLPQYFANPVRKTHWGNVTEIENPYAHLVFYEILYGGAGGMEIDIDNQFSKKALNISFTDFLAVPSLKLHHEPIP